MTSLWGKHSVYRPYVERLDDASTEEEVQTILGDVRDFTISFDDLIEKGLGYGLWKPVEYDSASITFEKHEDHPQADNTDIERWVWQVISSDQSFFQAFKQDAFDYGGSIYQRNVQQPPAGIEPIAEYQGRFGRKLAMSWRNPHLARRPVRRAIAYFIDLEGLSRIISSVSAVTQQTGSMPDSLVAKWVGEDFLDRLIGYGVRSRPEKAAAEMRRAGYEKRNGVWTDSDGRRMEGLRLLSQSESDAALIGDTVSEQLAEFGIETDFSALEGGSYTNVMNYRSGTGDFDLAIHQAGPRGPHPAQMWNYTGVRSAGDFQIPANISPKEECSTEAPEVEWIEETTPLFKIPVNPAPAFPKTVGQERLDGEDQHRQPIKTSSRLRFEIGDEQIRELSRRWAWWINFNMFHVQLHSFDRQLWLDTANFQYDDTVPPRGGQVGTGPMINGGISLTK
jgi:ABC-type transport system substrate-binding protein